MLFNALPEFQFHKGTIRTTLLICAHPSLSDFNSIKVRLERVFGLSLSLWLVDFNSIKVRLEPLKAFNIL